MKVREKNAAPNPYRLATRQAGHKRIWLDDWPSADCLNNRLGGRHEHATLKYNWTNGAAISDAPFPSFSKSETAPILSVWTQLFRESQTSEVWTVRFGNWSSFHGCGSPFVRAQRLQSRLDPRKESGETNPERPILSSRSTKHSF